MINNHHEDSKIFSKLSFRDKQEQKRVNIGEQGINFSSTIIKLLNNEDPTLNLNIIDDLIDWGFQGLTTGPNTTSQIFQILNISGEDFKLNKLCTQLSFLNLPMNYPLNIPDPVRPDRCRKIQNGVAYGLKNFLPKGNTFWVRFFSKQESEPEPEPEQGDPATPEPEPEQGDPATLEPEPEQGDPATPNEEDPYNCIKHCPGGLHRRASGKLTYPSTQTGFPFSGNWNNPGSSISGVMRCVHKIQNVRRGSIQTNFLENNVNNLGKSEGNIGGYGRGPRNTF